MGELFKVMAVHSARWPEPAGFEMTFRDAQPADAAAIDRVFRTSFCDTFAHSIATEDLRRLPGGASRPRRGRPSLRTPPSPSASPRPANRSAIVKLAPLKLPVETEAPAIELRQLYVLKAHHGAGIAARADGLGARRSQAARS